MIGGLYDPNTDKIYAKPRTLTYYHEEGHQKWFKKGIESYIQSYQWTIIICAVAVYGINLKNIVLGIIFCLPVILLIVSEMHAWIFAFKKYWENNL